MDIGKGTCSGLQGSRAVLPEGAKRRTGSLGKAIPLGHGRCTI